MRIDRIWAMPSKHTFTIKPIRELLAEEVGLRDVNNIWIDPYAGKNSPAQITNDLNPAAPTVFHTDALEFLRIQEQLGVKVDGAFFDPPYSLRQLKECYTDLNFKPQAYIFNAGYQARQKDILARIIKPGGKAISFGWHTNGIGKKRGFEITRILMVAHGRQHNDTLVTVERKL